MPLTANASGTIEGTLTIPENVPSGTKLVVFAGNQEVTEKTPTPAEVSLQRRNDVRRKRADVADRA